MAPMRKRWTIEERMTLHHLFALIGYRAKDADWFRIYQQLHDTSRGETTIYEDWRFGGLKDRGLMWEQEIRLAVSQYSAAQRTAFYTSRANIDATASRLNITIPNNPIPHNAQTVNAPTLIATPVATTLLPAGLLSSNPSAAATASSNAVASGSSTSNTQQVRTGEAASSSKKHKATVYMPASQPSPAAETPAIEPQRQSVAAGKRRQTVTFDIDSDSYSADGLFSISDVLKKGRGKQQARDDKETQDAAIASEMVKGYGDKKGAATEVISERGCKESDNTIDYKSNPTMNDSTATTRMESDDSMDLSNLSIEEDGTPEMNNADDAEDADQVTAPAGTGEEVSPEDPPTYAAWQRRTLHDILLTNHENRYPAVEEPYQDDEEPPAEPKEFSPGHRALNFFMDMFGGHRDHIIKVMASEKTPNDEPGHILQGTYDTLCKELGELSVQPKYQLSEVFSSPASPFWNLSLASQAWGQELQMLHRNQVNFTGVGAKFVVVCGERRKRVIIDNVVRFVEEDDPARKTLTASEVSFIDREEPIFKRGGRVYSVEVHQPSMAILGEERAFNTASVKIDTMLCDAKACSKCSPDGVLDTSATSGMPRVHFRHLGRPGKIFTQVDPNPLGIENEDTTGRKFPDYAPLLPDDVQFWDGFEHKVITCCGPECSVCQEAARLRSEEWGTMKDFRKRVAEKEAADKATAEAAKVAAAQARASHGRGRGRVARGGRDGRGGGRGRGGRA